MTDPKIVLIIGTGLIGTSVGLALRHSSAQVQVLLSDTNADTLERAVRRGAGSPVGESGIPDLVVVAVPPRSIAEVAASCLARYPDATVTDVASVKAAPIAKLRSITAGADRFVGGHPMAGREVSGPEAARADLFEDRLWVVTAAPDNPPDRVEDVRWLALACGSLVIELTPVAHDRAVALTSHTPQLVASVLAAQLADADPADVAVSGQGLRDATRLAGSNPDLWSDILAGNAAEVALIVRRIQDQLGTIADALTETNRRGAVDGEQAGSAIDPVWAALDKGNAGRRALPDKHGGQAHTYEVIPVVVDDKPGELARLFAAAGEAGVNLEDVRIEHAVGRLTAIIELDVRPAAVATLRKAIEAGGWQVRG